MENFSNARLIESRPRSTVVLDSVARQCGDTAVSEVRQSRRVTGADYPIKTVALAVTAGFRTAFSTHARFAHPSEGPLERSRLVAMSDVSPAEPAHRIAYRWPR